MNTPNPTLNCPHCAKPLPEFTLRAAAGLLAKRGKGGRPKSDAPRCPCGEMTLKRAEARKHKCEA